MSAANSETRGGAHRYFAYGLRIASDVELWGSTAASFGLGMPADIDVLQVASSQSRPPNKPDWADVTSFEWPDFAQIDVLHGRRILVAAGAQAEPRELSVAIAGPALAAALGQRGSLVLHGTCVAFGDVAVCLLGDSGAGKSTLAAALCAAGGALVSDTMTVVDGGADREGPRAWAGPAQLKLWPDAARSFGYDPDSLLEAVPGSDKRVCPFAGRTAESARLVRIYVLSASGPVGTHRLRPAAATARLIQNHFLSAYLDDAQRAHWLPACARLVENVEVHLLLRGTSLADLNAVVDAVGGA